MENGKATYRIAAETYVRTSLAAMREATQREGKDPRISTYGERERFFVLTRRPTKERLRHTSVCRKAR